MKGGFNKMTINCSTITDPNGICTNMESAGAGLGVFLQYLGASLPAFLIMLAIISIIVGIGLAVAFVIKKFVSGVHMR